MIELLDQISKEHESEHLIELIESKKFGDRIEMIGDGDTKLICKLLLLNLKALADKGMKTRAHMLSQEYYSQEDLDGDNAIYGVDWIYRNPPPVLQSIKSENRNIEKRDFTPRRV